MANQIIIDIGAAANDGTGDPLRTAFNYVNDNFSNIWATGVANSNIGFSGNKILTINTNGNLVLAPNGIGKVVSNVDIRPNANNTLSLGSSALRWNSVYTQNLDVGGNVSFADITVDGNLTVTGNIIEMGNIVTDAKTIQLANTAANASSANGSGITVGASDNIATLLYNSTSNIWTTNIGISATGNVSGTYFIGNGSQLTGLPATYGNSNVATLLSSFGSNSISTTGNISAGYFVGNGALLTGISTSSLGNLSVTGSAIQLATGAPNTSVYLTANGVSGNAYVRVPSNPTTLSDGLSIVNLYGRVEIKAKDGAATQSWYFQEDGSLQLPGSVPAHITSDNDVVIQTGSGDHWTFGVDGILTVPGNIIPETSNTQSLGNATNQWSDLWVSNATIYMNSVPISLNSGNVMTVNGADVVTTNTDGNTVLGNLQVIGSGIYIADGSPETLINISPDPEGWAFLQLPDDATANSTNTRLHNDAGNVEISTGDFSTGSSSYTWYFDNTGNLAIPGTIVSESTVRIDNRESGNTADIQLYSADDILLQGRDRTLGDDIEGGDINIYAGDGSPDDAGGGTGSGGDIQIIGGVGGAANVSSAGGGGTVRLDAGNGGDGSATAAAGSGATAYLSAGDGGIDNGGGGNNGGDVIITAGDTTDVAQDRGSIILNAGAGGDASTTGGYVQVNIPSVGANPGGQWTFTGSGTTLETPANAEIFGPNFGNLTVGAAGNTIITSADYGFSTYNWVFDNAGGIVFPTLTVTRGDRTGTLTGSTIRIGNSTQEAILTTPNGAEGSDSQRLVINPGAGDGFGEGGDIYLYSGRGGSSGGSGGDIKIRGGLGPADGDGGYLDIMGGEAAGNGAGGYIDILGGQSGNAAGGPVRIYGGQGRVGGDANITGGVSTAGPGGGVNITGGTSSNGLAEYGNVTITSGASTWTFNNTGNLIVPGEGVIRSIDDTIILQSYDTPNSIARGLRVGTNGGLYLEQGSDHPWLSFTVDSGDAEIGAAPGVAGTGNAGYSLTLFGGPADTSVYGTGAGGNINLQAGLGATNDGGGGGQGGSINITAGNSYDPAGVAGNVVINTGGANTWTFDNTGLLTAPGNISATNFVGNGAALTNVATLGTGSWTVATGTNSYSFTVDQNESYTMWVNGNIPNGIVVWNATVTLTNNNVPAIGSQYGWFYEAGNALVLNSIPDQIIGTVGSISNASPSVANTNVFTFSITNNSGNSQTVNYGWTKIS